MMLFKSVRIVFIGCVEFSKLALAHLITNQPSAEIVGVVSKSTSLINDDHYDLGSLAEEHKIPYLDYKKNQSSLESFISSCKPDVVYCFGWSHILKPNILNIATHGVVGFHPSKLPENRGRHPIIWALVLGLKETGTTFFIMDEGVDSGPIISQSLIGINKEDNAKSLYNKIVEEGIRQIATFTEQFAVNDVKSNPQNSLKATYWRKRTYADGIIDWRMSAKSINNLIRALSKPYCGAEFNYKEQLFKVWESFVFTESISTSMIPGTVMRKLDGGVVVKCGDGSALLIKGDDNIQQITVGELL